MTPATCPRLSKWRRCATAGSAGAERKSFAAAPRRLRRLRGERRPCSTGWRRRCGAGHDGAQPRRAARLCASGPGCWPPSTRAGLAESRDRRAARRLLWPPPPRRARGRSSSSGAARPVGGPAPGAARRHPGRRRRVWSRRPGTGGRERSLSDAGQLRIHVDHAAGAAAAAGPASRRRAGGPGHHLHGERGRTADDARRGRGGKVVLRMRGRPPSRSARESVWRPSSRSRAGGADGP